MLTYVLYLIIEEVLPILSRSFLFLLKFNDFDEHVDVVLAEKASDPDVAEPECLIRVSVHAPRTRVYMYVMRERLFVRDYTEHRVSQITASLAGGFQQRVITLKPTDTAGMLLTSLRSSYEREVVAITYRNALITDARGLIGNIFKKSTGFKVQVWIGSAANRFTQHSLFLIISI